MAQYLVTAECVIDGKHYTRPSDKPVEVSAADAKHLADCLTPVNAPAEPKAELKAEPKSDPNDVQ